MSIHWDKPNKCWRFQFDRVIQGRRHRLSRLLPKGWTQAQADEHDRREGSRLAALANGVGAQDPLITEAVQLYITDKKHLKSYDGTVENLMAIAWAYEGKCMSELPKVSEKVRAKPEWSAATKKNRLAILKAACRWAWKQHGLTTQDPTSRMILPEVRNERHVYASRLDVGRLAWCADRRDVRAMILAAFYTGMRFGELLRVEVSGDALHLSDTKNGDRRSIPVHARLKPLLRYLPLSAPRSTLQRGWQRARKAAKLPLLHLHDLRHSAASEMINAEIDLYTVGAVLGHKDPRSTKRYAHLRHGTLLAAVGTIGRKSPHKGGSDKKKATG